MSSQKRSTTSFAPLNNPFLNTQMYKRYAISEFLNLYQNIFWKKYYWYWSRLRADPPPPAPVSIKKPSSVMSGIDYFSYTRNGAVSNYFMRDICQNLIKAKVHMKNENLPKETISLKPNFLRHALQCLLVKYISGTAGQIFSLNRFSKLVLLVEKMQRFEKKNCLLKN